MLFTSVKKAIHFLQEGQMTPPTNKHRTSKQGAESTSKSRDGGRKSEGMANGAASGVGRANHPMGWLGQEIKSLRKAKGMTLQQLAVACGKSIGFLSQVERGLSAPTISDLHDIAESLSVQISWFFPQGEAAEPSDGGVVVRKKRRRQLSFASGIADYLLSPNLNGPLELLWSVMEPGADSGEAYNHVGDEAGVVIRGRLELWVGDQHFLLEEGDSFTFPSTTPHRYRNPGSANAELLWVVTPPSY